MFSFHPLVGLTKRTSWLLEAAISATNLKCTWFADAFDGPSLNMLDGSGLVLATVAPGGVYR
jgi:hypothetical protein